MLDANKLCPGCMKESTGDRICGFCGYDSLSKNDVDCLNAKFTLNERYIIGKIIDRSSEGVTYIALDTSNNSVVNIREYFPLNITVRNPDKTVSVTNDNDFYFNEGLLEFIELNNKLKELDSPALIPVCNVFEDNGTAYAVFETVSGISLSDFLERNGGLLKWEQARPLFLPLIDTVVNLNEAGIIHGGISPESIIVGRDGKLRICNISIIETRFASESFETGIYPGCAAPEQYSTEKGNIGSFTDVYGISATLFRVLIGTLPPPAKERILADNMSIPAKFADELPRQVLVAIANGLQLKIQNRTVSTERFRDELVYGETYENIHKAEVKRKQKEIADEKRISEKIDGKKKTKKKSSSLKYALISALCTVVVFVVLGLILSFTVLKGYFFPDNSSSSSKVVASMPSVASIGEIDPGADKINVKLYSVPNLKGKYFSELEELDECEPFQIEIAGKKYDDNIPRGMICAQSVASGKEVERNTKINVTISLGSKSFKMPNLSGLTEDKAKLELLKKGFLYENIEIIEKYDADSEPKTVVDQTPVRGEAVNTDMAVKVYINSYTDETTESASDGSIDSDFLDEE